MRLCIPLLLLLNTKLHPCDIGLLVQIQYILSFILHFTSFYSRRPTSGASIFSIPLSRLLSHTPFLVFYFSDIMATSGPLKTFSFQGCYVFWFGGDTNHS